MEAGQSRIKGTGAKVQHELEEERTDRAYILPRRLPSPDPSGQAVHDVSWARPEVTFPPRSSQLIEERDDRLHALPTLSQHQPTALAIKGIAAGEG